MTLDIEKAVRELIDRAAITEVLHSYARLLDERDFTGAAGAFAEDCLVEYSMRDADILRSPAAVADWLRRQVGTATTSHHISNVLISLHDADHAEATSYVYAWHDVPDSAIDPVILARYVDTFERTPAGWRVARRRMLAHGAIGFPEGILRPLSRQPGWAPDHSVIEVD